MKEILIWLLVCSCYLLRSQDSTITLYRSVPPKNPGVAFTLSTLIPGAGLMYNDQVKLGIAVLLAEGTLLYTGNNLLEKYNTQDKYHLDINLNIANNLMLSAGILHLAQMFYSALYAEHWNKKHGFGKKNISRLKVAMNNSGIGISFALK